VKMSVLIPYRAGSDHWKRVFTRTQQAWHDAIADAPDLDIEIVVGEQTWEGPMQVSRCINQAAAQATGDVFVLWGADHWPDVECLRWASAVIESNDSAWQPLFAETGIMSYETTRRIVNGATPDSTGTTWSTVVPLCIGIFAVSRDAFFEVGGEDERFVGWGMEDAALRHTLTAFYGESQPVRPGTMLKALWHPVQAHDDTYALGNVVIYHTEYVALDLSREALELTLERARSARVGY
jgi:hypothetical protein